MQNLDLQGNGKGQGFLCEFSCQGKAKKQKFASFWNWRTGLYVLNEQCASTKDLDKRTEWRVSTAARMWERQRKVDLGQIEKKQKAQLLAERSVEGSSRPGLIRVSWKSAGFGCAGSAAMAPGSVLSTYTTIFLGNPPPEQAMFAWMLLSCCKHAVIRC